MALVKDLAQMLKGEGAVRVILFGSLADGRFTRESDIDLAVGGLTERALARLEYDFTILARRPVELANLGCMPESLRQSIERFGVELV
jgi:predicted nucleotidyltransferase